MSFGFSFEIDNQFTSTVCPVTEWRSTGMLKYLKAPLNARDDLFSVLNFLEAHPVCVGGIVWNNIVCLSRTFVIVN